MRLLSIVTPCLNRATTIREAIESAMCQEYGAIEHVVMDGGSIDGTLEILKQYPHLRIVSEPDRDVYDALSKGIRLAEGEVIGQLNSDDYYEPNIFKKVMHIFEEYPEVDALVGGADVFEDMSDGKRRLIASYLAPSPENPWECVTTGVPLFNAWFFRKRVFEQVGGYNNNFHLAADRDLLIRFFIMGGKWLRLEQTVYHYRQHAGSLTLNGLDDSSAALREEYFSISEKYIRDGDAPIDLKESCRAWFRRDTIEFCLRSLYLKHFFRALYYAKRGMQYDSGWFKAFWLRLTPTLLRRMGMNKPNGAAHA